MKTGAKPWTEADVARMIELREVEGKKWSEIDAILGRPEGGSANKYQYLRRGKDPRGAQAGAAGGRIELSQKQIATRAARTEAAKAMTLTASVFGDPPPGFSALDRRRP